MSNTVTLEQLLRMKVSDNLGEHTPEFRVSVQEQNPEKGVRIIIHANGYNSETLDFWVKGDRLSQLEPPQDCPHAAPHRYCQQCPVDPCPVGLGKPAE